MKIGIIVGTRPEIIKMAPVIRECEKRNVPYFIIHSNQHYSKEMDSIFFEELHLPAPHYNLGVGSGLHSNQTGNILIKMEPILLQEKPDVVLVQGDTNTVLAGALAASKLNIKVGHIEAGLRSYDRTMPEETNRIMTDHISEYLFAVGPNQEKILKSEGIDHNKIHTVGNTVSDSLFQHLEISANTSNILSDLKLTAGEYFLVTAHRASNVDVSSNLLELLHLFDEMHKNYTGTIVWPIHPRTQAKLKEFNINIDYEFAIYSNELATKIQSDNFENVIESTFGVPIFSDENNQSMYKFLVNFPDDGKFILSSLIGMILLSVLFTSVIIIAYSSALFQLVKQRKISEIKTDFINNMTHEFKTPIASISLSSEAMLKNEDIKSNQRLNNYTKIINEQATRLNSQVEKVLQIAQLQNNEIDLKIEPINLVEIINNVLRSAKVNYENKAGVINFKTNEKEVIINADKMHLTNILYNLLDNSFKYNDSKPEVVIELNKFKNHYLLAV